jgi:hypothetical protein
VSATWIGSRLIDLSACVCEALAASTNGPVCWCGVVAGEVALDACGACDGDACGQAWVRVTGAYPYDTFPVQADDTTACGTYLAYEVEVGVSRCYPIPEGTETLTEAETLDSALMQIVDMEALRKAVLCCFGTEAKTLGAWTPAGPDGGCIGGTWAVTIGEG